MNKIKIYTIAAITALSASAVTAQDNYRPWLVGAGVSTVDFKVPERSVMKDWFGYPDMNIGFRLNAARYIKKGITAEAGFAYASIKKDQTYFPDVEETKLENAKTYWAFDVRGRYHLNRLWDALPWLDPYPQVGVGFASVDSETKFKFIAGLGVNFWFTDVVGANVNTAYNVGGGTGHDYYQWGAGVVLKLPLTARENPIVDHVERTKEPKVKEKKDRKRVSANKAITRVETPEEREERTKRVVKQINLYAKTILFDTDKSVVKPQAEFILDNIAVIMNENPDFNFVVEGHTDNTGTPEHNLKLSQDRADAIKQYLSRHGVSKKRLEAKGYGQTRPIESNETERGKEINRRVEINVVKDNQ